MNTLKERLRYFLKSKGITIQSFEASIEAANGYLSHIQSPTAGVLEKIMRVYSELNIEWLISGKGEMLKSNIEYEENLILHYTDARGLIGILDSMRHNFSLYEKSDDIKERRLIEHEEVKRKSTIEKPKKLEYVKKFKWISFFKKPERSTFIRIDGEERVDMTLWQPKMYDQYADCHKGGCIEYYKDKLLENNTDVKFSDITYEQYPAFPKETVEEELKYKTYSYRDEQECRIIYNGDAEYIKINMDCISKIYLGCNFFDDKIKVKQFCDIIDKYKIHPEKIIEINIKKLDYLSKSVPGGCTVNGSMVSNSWVQNRPNLNKLIQYLSAEYKSRYPEYFRDDIPQTVINIKEERYYKKKYEELKDEYTTLLKEKDKLNDKHVNALEKTISLQAKIIFLNEEIVEIKNELVAGVGDVITALMETGS